MNFCFSLCSSLEKEDGKLTPQKLILQFYYGLIRDAFHYTLPLTMLTGLSEYSMTGAKYITEVKHLTIGHCSLPRPNLLHVFLLLRLVEWATKFPG